MASILIDTGLVDPESAWFEWSAKTLENLDQNNTMVINPFIYAECSVGFECIEGVEAFFDHLVRLNRHPQRNRICLQHQLFWRPRLHLQLKTRHC